MFYQMLIVKVMIYLLISFDNGENYTQLFNVSGDVGENIAVGNNKQIVWNADNNASGVYFVKMVAGDFVNTQKLILVK